ncbi:MAG: ATP-dependent DNA helicase [Candidatus Verstraetearchaeota archaeon]|nr:ATP-dependent DNA helicase [Candidatus Verstraetearchaeota archaeon]
MNTPTLLSDDQIEAVLSKSKYTRVIAGAGAGKTETLTRRIVYLIAVEGVNPSEIVAFTFTEKAARRMKSRIYQRVGEICGGAATANLGEMYVGTIHAYAKRILEDHFGFGNYEVLDENQEVAFLMRHGWSKGIQNLGGPYSECCRAFLRTVNMAWDEMLDREQLEERAPGFFRKLEWYEGLLQKHRLLTFGSIVYEAASRLREAPDKLGSVKHLLVDEYQDINRAQASLIECIGRYASVFAVGDPRQSIYQWRGSDERFFFEFPEKFPGAKLVSISENRRSGKRIVWSANRFAGTFTRVRYEAMNAVRKEDGFVAVASSETPEDEAKWIVDQIEGLMKENEELRYSDFGILTRSVSHSAGPLIEELKRRRIPYIVGGKVGLFKRDETLAVGMIFSWFWDDGFWIHDARNWRVKITGDDLLAAALDHWDAAHAHGHPRDAEEKLRAIKEDLNSAEPSYSNFTEVYYDVLNALGYRSLDYADRDDAAVMANLGRFNNLLTDFESANRFGGRGSNWKRDLKGLCWFMNTYAISAYDEQPSDDIRGVDAVQVMTVHQAKGLEWPIVFLFATVDGLFPSGMVGREQNWCGVPRDLFDAARYEGGEEDERRLFYVALTRARDALIISHYEGSKRGASRSPFIGELDTSNVVWLSGGAAIPQIAVRPGGANEEIQTFSSGEIVTFGICPHMYLLRELWGYQPGIAPAIGYGKGMHHCLKLASGLVKEGQDPVNAVAASVDQGFHMPFVGGLALERFRENAKERLAVFAKRYGDDLRRTEEVEYRLEFPINDAGVTSATIMGKVDVVLREEDGLEVREYKSSEEARTFEEVSAQIRLYAAGLKEMGRNISRASVVYLDDADVKPVDISGHRLAEAKKTAQKVIRKIARREFEPTPGESCRRCDQSKICRWRR